MEASQPMAFEQHYDVKLHVGKGLGQLLPSFDIPLDKKWKIFIPEMKIKKITSSNSPIIMYAT